MFIANCRVSILRGTFKDPFGDPIESDIPVQTGVPMSILEVASNETTMAGGMPRQVRYLVGRAHPGTDIRHEDRLKVEDGPRANHIYLVDGIDEVSESAILDSGTRLELRRVS